MSCRNSYPTQASGGAAGGGGGYQSRRPNPYAQQDDRTYEMSDVKDNSAAQYNAPMGGGGGGDSMSAFYTEASHLFFSGSLAHPRLLLQISSIQDSLRTFNDNVTRISDLHSRSLNNTDDTSAQRNAAQLDDLIEDTSALSATLKRRIKALEKQGGSGRDGQIRKQQVRTPQAQHVSN